MLLLRMLLNIYSFDVFVEIMIIRHDIFLHSRKLNLRFIILKKYSVGSSTRKDKEKTYAIKGKAHVKQNATLKYDEFNVL